MLLACFAMILAVTGIGPGPPTMAELSGHLVQGRRVALRFERDGRPAAGVVVTARYRENASRAITHQEDVGTTGADGTLAWTPEDAGVVVLSWEGGSRNVSVLYARTPLLGVLIAVFAGIVLVGGSVWTFFRMRAEETKFHGPEVPGPEM